MALLFIRFMFTPLGSSTKKRLHWHWDLKVFFFFHSGGLKLVGSGSWSWNMWFILGLVRLVFQSHTIHFSAAVVPVPFWPSLVVVYPFEWLTAAQQQRLFVGKKAVFGSGLSSLLKLSSSSGWSWKVQNHNGWEIAHFHLLKRAWGFSALLRDKGKSHGTAGH